MVDCPFYQKAVDGYKSNSHIIPKSFIKPAKASGALAYLGVLDGLIEKRQDGTKADFICATCEDAFSQDDSYGSVILLNTSPQSKYRNGVTERRVPLIRMTFHEIAGFDFAMLKSFLLSIVLRDHCKRLVFGDSTLMDSTAFEAMRDVYRNRPATNDKFKIVIHKVENLVSGLSTTVSLPTMSNLGDAITFTCGGYAVMVYLDDPKDSSMAGFVNTCGLIPPGKLFMPITDFTALGTFRHAKDTITTMMKGWELKFPPRGKRP